MSSQIESLIGAQKALALQMREEKDAALLSAARAIDGARSEILKANKADVLRAEEAGMKASLIDRLSLNEGRIDSIIEGLKEVAALPDPIGRVLDGWTLPNGLFIEKIAVPIGLVAIIYESRPNVTVEAFSLAYKTGCSILLRGSSAAQASNKALVAAIKKGLGEGGGVPNAVELAPGKDHSEIDEILNARGKIDVVLPRGGHSLIRHVVENARIPVIETGEGNCHIYVESSALGTEAGLQNTLDIIENAKMQKPGACNAVETLLVHKDAVSVLIPALVERLGDKCELRMDEEAHAEAQRRGVVVTNSGLATESDWETEFLDYILAVKTVSGIDEAIEHINKYGTKHSEAILTNDMANAERFCAEVDAACVYVNASIRFTDGGCFGFGAELGISTQKFHARGPMGMEALTTYKYRVKGSGQIRL
jgi:glutamate-5-semialdehyde dehydrogenase